MTARIDAAFDELADLTAALDAAITAALIAGTPTTTTRPHLTLIEGGAS